MTERLLIVEDELHLAEVISDNLALEWDDLLLSLEDLLHARQRDRVLVTEDGIWRRLHTIKISDCNTR